MLPLDLVWRDVLDIALVAMLFYAVIISMKRANAGLALAGMLILGAVYVLASQFGLGLTAWILRGFATVFLILLVVVFQRDFRLMFERIAVWSLRRSPLHKPSEEGTEALTQGASRRQGALVVIPGKDPLARHLRGGVPLDGKLSQALLLSLFDPGSIGHDGAVVIQEDRISDFSVHLPLSSNFSQIGRRGTRHSAALGLAERTDALCVVVSEETGDISIARDGALYQLHDKAELRDALNREMSKVAREKETKSAILSALSKDWLDRIAAVVLAVAAWFVFASGSQIAQRTVLIPVMVENIHPNFTVEGVEPKEVSVTVTGLRRDLYLLDPLTLEVRVDAFLIGFGRRTFEVSSNNVSHPRDLTVLDIEPRRVTLSVAPVVTPDGASIRPSSNPCKRAPERFALGKRSEAAPGKGSVYNLLRVEVLRQPAGAGRCRHFCPKQKDRGGRL